MLEYKWVSLRGDGVGDAVSYIGGIRVEVGGNEFRYEGEVGYEGIRLGGNYELSGVDIGIGGYIRGGIGEYEVGVGKGELKGVEIGLGVCRAGCAGGNCKTTHGGGGRGCSRG